MAFFGGILILLHSTPAQQWVLGWGHHSCHSAPVTQAGQKIPPLLGLSDWLQRVMGPKLCPSESTGLSDSPSENDVVLCSRTMRASRCTQSLSEWGKASQAGLREARDWKQHFYPYLSLVLKEVCPFDISALWAINFALFFLNESAFSLWHLQFKESCLLHRFSVIQSSFLIPIPKFGQRLRGDSGKQVHYESVICPGIYSWLACFLFEMFLFCSYTRMVSWRLAVCRIKKKKLQLFLRKISNKCKMERLTQ